MKPFWDNLRFDLENCEVESVIEAASQSIRDDLEAIESCIKDLDLRSALDKIHEAKKYY